MTRPTRSWLPAFLALAAIWGSSFLFIKVAVDADIHPVYVTLGRVGTGALVLVVMVVAMRDRLPRDPRLWGHLAVVAFIMNVVPFTLFGYGEQRISSILAGIWNATTPLWTLAVSLAVLPQERPTRAKVSGLLIGFVGVLIVLGVWQGVGGAGLLGQLMCFGAAVCYGIGLPYTRRYVSGRAVSGTALSASQLLLGTAQLALIAPLLAGAPPNPADLPVKAIASVVALGALGTGIAFALSYHVIRLAGVTTSATVTYLVPLFATAIGVLALGERISWYEPVGAVVVLSGVAVSQGLLTRRRTVPSTPSPQPVPVGAD